MGALECARAGGGGARNVTRTRGHYRYTCEYKPCARCKRIHCPKYQCSVVHCGVHQKHYTPRDADGCKMCPACKDVRRTIDDFDNVEDEKDTI